VVRQIFVNLTELNSKPSNFDLIICSANTLDVSSGSIPAQITRSVHAIPGAFIELSLWLFGSRFGKLLIFFGPFGVIGKLAVNKFGLGKLVTSQISFSQPSSSDIDLSNLPHIIDAIPVLSVHDQKLDTLHSLSSRDHIPHVV
jgi:hypothetical protein